MSASNSRKLLRPCEAAAYLGISPSTLAKMRMRGNSPPFVRVTTRAVAYVIADLDAYLAARKVSSTSDRGPSAQE